MTMSNSLTAQVDHPSDREVRFVRLLDAPPALVWSIWSEPRHLHAWFGPAGYSVTTEAFDFRPGGEWRFVMHAPDGTDIPNRIRFLELQAPDRLVYENGWDLPGAPLDFLVTWTFVPAGTRTRLEVRMTFEDPAALKTAVERYGVSQGGPSTIARIVEYLTVVESS